MRQQKTRRYDVDSIAEERIRDALRPIDDARAPLELPKTTPVAQLQHWGLKPAPARVKKTVPR